MQSQLQVERVTRERIIHRLFTSTQFTTTTTSPIPAWPLVVWKNRQEKELCSGNVHVFRRGDILEIGKYKKCLHTFSMTKTFLFSFSSCFISSSDNVLRSIEKLFITPFHQWENMPRNIEQHMQCHRANECLEWVSVSSRYKRDSNVKILYKKSCIEILIILFITTFSLASTFILYIYGIRVSLGE